jgi:putative PIN family toxin of toxin-antitoxin system
MRVVLDTNILVRANTLAKGPARELLLRLASSSHTLLISSFLLDETERVLAYPRLRSRWLLTQEDIREHVEFLSQSSEMVPLPPGPRVVLKGSDDDAVIQTAVAGRADILCTLDQHFYDARVMAFCEQRGIRIVSDVELLQELEGKRKAFRKV